MPQPSSYDVHVDAILTNFSLAYIQNPSNFIATKAFPIVPTPKQSDKYFKYTQGDWFRDEAAPRADASESAGSGYGISTDSYFATTYAIHKDVGNQVLANADAPIDLEREAVEFCTQRILIRTENQFASDFMTTGVWTATGSDSAPVSGLWSNQTSSSPIEDIETAKSAVLTGTGFMPNKLIMGYQVWAALRNHPELVDRYKYTSSASITQEMAAALFGLDEILVSMAVYNTAVEGATVSNSFAVGKNALLAYVAPNVGPLTATAGVTFAWTGVSDGLGASVGVKSFVMPQLGPATRYEAEAAWANKVVGAPLGFFWSGAVA